VLVLGYGFLLTFAIMSEVVADLDHSGKYKGSQGIFRWRLWIHAITLDPANRSAGCLMFLCGIILLIAGGLLVVHVRYVYLGTTTNESMKWQVINECVEDGNLWFYDHPTQILREQSHKRDEPSVVLQKLSDGTFHRSLMPQEQQLVLSRRLVLKEVTGLHEINNIYDHGFLANFKELMFPLPNL
jgi:hypothetical protein